MIGFLKGKILSTDEDTVLLDTGGVGYQVFVPTRCVFGLRTSDELSLFIHTSVRENALDLFGFLSAWEKKVFLTLTSVSGVGPKTALGILSGVEPDVLLKLLVRQDKLSLTKIPGIGKKTSERIVLELADKAQKILLEKNGSSDGPKTSIEKSDSNVIPAQGASAYDIDLIREAVQALVGLGYKEQEASSLIQGKVLELETAGATWTTQELVRQTLQSLSKSKFSMGTTR